MAVLIGVYLRRIGIEKPQQARKPVKVERPCHEQVARLRIPEDARRRLLPPTLHGANGDAHALARRELAEADDAVVEVAAHRGAELPVDEHVAVPAQRRHYGDMQVKRPVGGRRHGPGARIRARRGLVLDDFRLMVHPVGGLPRHVREHSRLVGERVAHRLEPLPLIDVLLVVKLVLVCEVGRRGRRPRHVARPRTDAVGRGHRHRALPQAVAREAGKRHVRDLIGKRRLRGRDGVVDAEQRVGKRHRRIVVVAEDLVRGAIPQFRQQIRHPCRHRGGVLLRARHAQKVALRGGHVSAALAAEREAVEGDAPVRRPALATRDRVARLGEPADVGAPIAHAAAIMREHAVRVVAGLERRRHAGAHERGAGAGPRALAGEPHDERVGHEQRHRQREVRRAGDPLPLVQHVAEGRAPDEQARNACRERGERQALAARELLERLPAPRREHDERKRRHVRIAEVIRGHVLEARPDLIRSPEAHREDHDAQQRRVEAALAPVDVAVQQVDLREDDRELAGVEGRHDVPVARRGRRHREAREELERVQREREREDALEQRAAALLRAEKPDDRRQEEH